MKLLLYVKPKANYRPVDIQYNSAEQCNTAEVTLQQIFHSWENQLVRNFPQNTALHKCITLEFKTNTMTNKKENISYHCG